MIVWLASYPRSGNTLLRMLLSRHFGLRSWSVHGDGDARDIGAELASIVGFEPHGPLGEDALAEMAASDETFLVKTHNLPPPGRDWPAICVVRDGRSALASYWHYRNRPGDVGHTMPEVVAGAVQFGSWSAHVAAWLDAPLSRRLVLRYEDLAGPSPGALAAIGDFLGHAPAPAPPAEFATLNALAPTHFRGGSDARNIAELQACCPALFDALHGPMQARLGYPPAMAAGDPEAALAAELAAAMTALREARDADRAGLEAALSTLRQELDGMRRSPFWRARERVVGLLRSAGLRRRG
ncbi:hypothetical protein FHS88_001004 [Roseomonas alkaliterrae]|uniref:Sulfotransferase domain-containing protein n=1 Tax=Neoroseomonas alkaliterrae TaxID=1452450 RepID=A0A840XK34_9PROT|nr:sulfotransferase domain-containing protein [Neoroseomonas alkaliterrae]MBB5688888.1 hypothetical protein [Neoroseomonas alkaliterrae]